MSGRPAVDAAELLRVPFALTRTVRARQGSIRRLRVGKSENRRTWAFDLIINHQITGGTESIANNYSAGAVELAKRVDGRIGLNRNGLMRRAETLDAPEVSAGTEELRGVFTVRATSETSRRVSWTRMSASGWSAPAVGFTTRSSTTGYWPTAGGAISVAAVR